VRKGEERLDGSLGRVERDGGDRKKEDMKDKGKGEVKNKKGR
jgi:hypothetical protein